MVGTRARKRAAGTNRIKENPEDEEMHRNASPTRRNVEEKDRELTSFTSRSDVGTETVKEEPQEEIEVTRKKIKSEPDEEWSDCEDEDEEESDDSDPDYESDYGHCFSDDSGDDQYNKRSTDGGDLCEQRRTSLNRSIGSEELRWKQRSEPDTKPDPLRFKPARTPGPTLDTSTSWTALSVFQLFFGTSVIRKIVENTNKNTTRQNEIKKRKIWTEITVKDFYMYLTTVLYSSLVKVHEHTDYWKKLCLYDFQFPRSVLSRTCFEQIQSVLSLCDPVKDEENESKKGTPEYEPLLKIQPFYTELVNACKAHFQPQCNICVYERKPRKNKPLKCGYRLFALADSATGYTWNLYIHTGKSAATRGQTTGYTAVKNLLPVSVMGSGYTLYTDSSFSSPRLFTELLDKNIGCCGILSKHHSEFPQDAQNDFPAPRASRGDIRWLRKDKLLFVKFMDTREVAMCSTAHEAFTGQVIHRHVKVNKGWVPKQFSCPDAVADFNRHMIVSGNSDFDFSCISNTRVKWHRTLFYHLLDLAVVNSFILYKQVLKVRGESTSSLTQKDFREMLCKEMYTFAKGIEPEISNLAPVPSDLTCAPVYYVHGSATEGRQLCKICSRKTPIYCQKCLVPLCLTCSRNCYKEWHGHKKC